MITLTGSVGVGGKNTPTDVAAVCARFRALGYSWVDTDLMGVIKLFQATCKGYDAVEQVDGRIDPAGQTLGYLNDARAPQWRLMTMQGVGFVNDERADVADTHDFGTHWLDDTITTAARAYNAWRLEAKRPVALIAVNDASLPYGGDTKAHAGHETGLCADLRLPRLDGGSGGIVVSDKQYDRDAMRRQLQALVVQPLFERALLNDSVLIAEKLCGPATGHDNHAHIEVRSPFRV
jgi:hypothetical protein